MLDLSEAEQKKFALQMRREIFAGLKPVVQPEFWLVLGAQGAGKSTLVNRAENAAKISPDEAVAKYFMVCGIDTRQDCYTAEIGDFAMDVCLRTMEAAAAKKFNIVYDAMSMNDAGAIVQYMRAHGYRTEIKAVINDCFTTALNVEERKLLSDEKFAEYKKNGGEYPKVNPLEVDSRAALINARQIEIFLRNADKKGAAIEVYRSGESQPSFITGKGGFEEFLHQVNHPSPDEYLQRCSKLAKKAKAAGKINMVQRLQYLQNQIGGYL